MSVSSQIKAIVFDIGHVLIDWDPRHLYRKVFDDEKEMEYFLETVCTPAWNESLDGGLPWDIALAERIEKFPHYKEQITAYRTRWHEMVPDALWETVTIMQELRSCGLPIYSITNFNHETFAETAQRFPFLTEFDGIIVSGDVRLTKPDPAIYHALIQKYNLIPNMLLFIDDRADNIAAAQKIGFNGIIFNNALQLRSDLENIYGLLKAV